VSATLVHTFALYGSRVVWAKCRDEFKYSQSQAYTIVVDPGIPDLSQISVDVADTVIFIADARKYSVGVEDYNGTIAALYFDVDDGAYSASYNVSSLGSDAVDTSFGYTFAIDNSGSHTVRVIAVDNDGMRDTTDKTINVRLGAPVVDSIVPDTVWVNDNNVFTVFWHDTNGTQADSFVMDSDFDGALDLGNSTGSFSHSFDTSEAGSHSSRAKVKDGDGVWSGEKVLPVHVRLGRPVVSGATSGDSIQWVEGSGSDRDTMFYVWSGSYTQTTMKVDTADSNGMCSWFYWDFDDNGSVNSTTTTTTTANGFSENTAYRLRVWCKDDDSLVSPALACIVYPDGPPPTPTSLAAGGSGSDVTIAWSGKDVKDGDGTLYQLLVRKGTTPPVDSDSLLVFRAGNTFGSGSAYGKDYEYTFTPNDGNGE